MTGRHPIKIRILKKGHFRSEMPQRAANFNAAEFST
jgi:hypothetical protein